jgi:hypothetical protein
MEKKKNEKTDKPVLENSRLVLYRRRPHETGVDILSFRSGTFPFSDNLLRARKKCRYSGGKRFCIRFRKNGINYLLGIQRRKGNARTSSGTEK